MKINYKADIFQYIFNTYSKMMSNDDIDSFQTALNLLERRGALVPPKINLSQEC